MLHRHRQRIAALYHEHIERPQLHWRTLHVCQTAAGGPVEQRNVLCGWFAEHESPTWSCGLCGRSNP